MLIFLLCSVASAFAPDRPGVGESTGSVPKHEAMIETGVYAGGALGDTPVLGLPALTGRVGLGKSWELRLHAPAAALALPGPISASGLAVGTKFSGNADGAVTWSVVPTLRFAPIGSGDVLGGTGGDVSVNVAHNREDFAVWANAVGGGNADGLAASGGGGASYAPDDVGLFINGGWSGRGYAGGGGWWVFGPDAQVDLGVDVAPGDNPVVIVSAGVSVQR